jgi:hypothetical protein
MIIAIDGVRINGDSQGETRQCRRFGFDSDILAQNPNLRSTDFTDYAD